MLGRWIRCRSVVASSIWVVAVGISAAWGLCRNLAIHRNPVALAIHALDIARIVALLADISGSTGRIDACKAAGDQAGTGADGCAVSPTYKRTRCRA